MVALLVALVASVGCAPPAAASNTVVWINVDGLRGDYPERAEATFLLQLAEEGASTKQLRPIFPSLTFPGHLAMATGRGVSGHGVTMNSYFDTADGEMHRFPADAKLVRAEGIWSTAARQGVRAAVVDWPMSHRQQDLTDFAPAAYYGQKYDGSIEDADRIDNLLSVWTSDESDTPLRLLMGYASEVDELGHREAIGSPAVLEAVREVDALLRDAHARAIEQFEKTAGPDDELYFIVSTDHGMAEVKTTIDLEVMLESEWDDDLRYVRSGSVATLFLSGDEATKPARIDAIMAKLENADGLDAWRTEDVPAEYEYSDPTRLGDIVLSATAGYSLSARGDQPYNAVPEDQPFSTHGYPVDVEPGMNGFLVVWRYRHKLGGLDLGPVDQRRLHPTVTKLLDIDPAPGVTVEPISFP